MAIENIFNDASSIMTLISFLTFVGIIWWVYGVRSKSDFDAAAQLPFADERDGAVTNAMEKHHG